MQPMTSNPLARGLADALEKTGDLVSPHWRKAVEDTPRHACVPVYYENLGGTPTRWRRLDPSHGDSWLNPIYTNTTLVTRLDPAAAHNDGTCTGIPTSSSTQPSLTVRMLEALGIEEDDEVLDGGTGSGYQAALIAHRLKNSQQLVTADIDPELTTAAQEVLRALNFEPGVLAADVSTWRWQRRFDKVIITCALPRITESLRQAVAPGGRLIANILPPLSSALVVLDALSDGSLEGRFHPDGGSFMPARQEVRNRQQPTHTDLPVTHEGATDVPVEAFDSYHFNFLLAAQLPGIQLQYGTDNDGRTMRRLVAPDGAWAELIYEAGKPTRYREAGDRGIWETVEWWWSWFLELGQPTWDRFGLTVTPDEHRLWFESPGGPTWALPA